VVDRATLVVRTRAADLLTVSAVVQLPIWLVLAVVLRDDWASGLADNTGVFWLAIFPDPLTLGYLFDEATASGPVAVLAARALPSMGLAVIGATCGHLVHDWALGAPTRGLDALGRVLRRGHSLLGLWLIVHAIEVLTCVGVFVGFLLFAAASPLWAIEASDRGRRSCGRGGCRSAASVPSSCRCRWRRSCPPSSVAPSAASACRC